MQRRLSARLHTWGRMFLYLDSKAAAGAGAVFLALVIISGNMVYQKYMAFNVNPAVYTPLLNTIAKGESHGNYNAYYGSSNNTTVHFTDMSIADVLRWQQDFINKGSPSSAVGKYQIVRPTLAGLVQKLKIDPNTKFNQSTQDTLAVALLEKRGALAFIQKRLSREQFAANLAQEWAALPRVTGPNPTQSYYAGDGLNKAHISIEEVYKALATLHT